MNPGSVTTEAGPGDHPHPIRVAVPLGLSIVRLILGVCFPWAPTGWRLGLVLAAGASDLVDGFISRLLRASTAAGQVLDRWWLGHWR